MKKYKDFFKYVLLSFFTSCINVLIYIIFINIFKDMHTLSNFIAWMITTNITFTLNKKIIFKDTDKNIKVYLEKMLKFYILRISSLIIDTIILKICIEFINMNYIIAKILSNCGTIFNNYLISKYYIFNNKK